MARDEGRSEVLYRQVNIMGASTRVVTKKRAARKDPERVLGPEDLDLGTARVVRRGPRVRSPRAMTLSELRRAADKTQVEVAEAMSSGQDEVSKLEKRADFKLSTLRAYVEALGFRVEVAAVLEATGMRVLLSLPK